MFAVTLASASSDWFGLALALAAMGGLGLLGPRSRTLLLGLAVAGLLAMLAVPFNCPPWWKYLGICGQ